MFPFRKKRKQKPEVDPTTADHVFDAIPQKAANVQADEGTDGRLRLTLTLQRPTGAAGVVARVLRFRNTVQVHLDKHGSRFWQMIDGHATLRDIEQALRKEWNLTEADSRRATVQFTKMLMARHLIALRIPREEAVHAD